MGFEVLKLGWVLRNGKFFNKTIVRFEFCLDRYSFRNFKSFGFFLFLILFRKFLSFL